MRKIQIVVVAFALASAHGAARAGGLGRPNVISARAFGYGGAFTAVADDASALHYNPAGLALQPRGGFLLGGELIFAPRDYIPRNIDGTDGEPQSPETRPNVVPSLGFTAHPSSRGVPSRLAFGIGVWNTFGGELHYPKSEDRTVPALDMVRDAVVEIVPGIAYEVNDFLAVGAALRIGVGLFAVEATAKPRDGSFSGIGVGAGMTVGMMIRPTSTLQFGLTWRSGLTVATSGSGSLQLADPPAPAQPVDVTHDQNWPQSLSFGVAWRATPKLRLAAQADWTDWSRVETIEVHFSGLSDLDQVYLEDWNDNYAVHAGGEFALTPSLAVRAGYTFDSVAVPDRTIERQYLDAPKHAVGIGGGVQLSDNWRIDTAFEIIFGPERVVPDNRMQYQNQMWPDRNVDGTPDRANIAPGVHRGGVYTFELQAQYHY